jgi:hypothetical protein
MEKWVFILRYRYWIWINMATKFFYSMKIIEVTVADFQTPLAITGLPRAGSRGGGGRDMVPMHNFFYVCYRVSRID